MLYQIYVLKHSSILDCLNTLEKMKEIEVTYILPEPNGIINPKKK
jgi:cysteine sulfinate desulfinase/cysteine desulfurase-like protein